MTSCFCLSLSLLLFPSLACFLTPSAVMKVSHLANICCLYDTVNFSACFLWQEESRWLTQKQNKTSPNLVYCRVESLPMVFSWKLRGLVVLGRGKFKLETQDSLIFKIKIHLGSGRFRAETEISCDSMTAPTNTAPHPPWTIILLLKEHYTDATTSVERQWRYQEI